MGRHKPQKKRSRGYDLNDVNPKRQKVQIRGGNGDEKVSSTPETNELLIENLYFFTEIELMNFLKERISIAFRVPEDDIGIKSCSVYRDGNNVFYSHAIFDNIVHARHALALKSTKEMQITPWLGQPTKYKTSSGKAENSKESTPVFRYRIGDRDPKCTVFVRNIPNDKSKHWVMNNLTKMIKEKCGKNNTISRTLLCMPVNANGAAIPRPTKAAFVEFEYPRHAALAVQLNPVEVDGHTLELLKWYDGIERTTKFDPTEESKSRSNASSTAHDKHQVMYLLTDSDEKKLLSKSSSDRTYASMAVYFE